MLKQIEVRSKSKAKEFISDVPWAAISIATYENDWPKLNGAKRMGWLKLFFEDAEFIREDSGYKYFNADLAKEIFDFMEGLDKDVELLLVHCEAGISRSPAIAAVLAQVYLEGDANLYFNKYDPNPLVYKILVEAAAKFNKQFIPYTARAHYWEE